MHHAPVIRFDPRVDVDPAGLRLSEHVSVTGSLSPSLSQGLSVIGAHGAGVLNGVFVSSTQDAVHALAGVQSGDLVRIADTMAGSLTVYVWDSSSKCVTILADPLGGSLVFIHRNSQSTAISSDIGALAAARSHEGNPLRKSLAHTLCTLVTGGSGGLVGGSYEDVSLLDHFHYVQVDHRGVHRKPLPSREQFYGAKMSYTEGLDAVEDEIRRNVRVVGQSSHVRAISQLTGGLDSRLVLAALLREGLAEHFAFNCMGNERTPDKVIAHRLAAHFGLTMTDATGLTAYKQPQTFNEKVLWAMRYSSGLHMTPAHQYMERSQSVVLAGGYGELMRSPYREGDSPLTATDPRGIAEAVWGPVGFGHDNRRLISTSLMDRYVQSIDDVLKSFASADFEFDAWRDYYYILRRNRYFVGEISRQWTPFASRFDPLYSKSAGQVMLRQPWSVRKSGIFQFDLMRRLQRELPDLPFDTHRVNAVHRSLRETSASREFEGSARPPYNDWGRSNSQAAWAARLPDPTKGQIDQATRLGAPIHQVILLDKVRRETKDLVSSLSQQERTDVFNLEALQTLGRRAEKHGWSLRSLFVIHSALLWHFDE